MQMKWWKTFLRNRKQNDRVKLELAAVLLGLSGMILAMVHGVALYQRLQTNWWTALQSWQMVRMNWVTILDSI